MEKKLVGTMSCMPQGKKREKKGDISFNVHFGYFDDDQLERITQKLVQKLFGKGITIIFNILLPKVIIRISRDFLEVTYNEANEYLKCLTCHSVEDMILSLT